MLIADRKKFGTKVLLASALILLGIVIGVVGVIALMVRNQPEPKSEEEARKSYIVDYTRTEEARLGIDCRKLKGELGDFLEKDVRPVLNARQRGQGWSTAVSPDLRKRMKEQREFFFACSRLYVAGRNGEWNGLKELGFSVELDREFTVMDILIRFGEPKQQCNAACLDLRFLELKESYDKIVARVRSS